jgi:hypothetical protein
VRRHSFVIPGPVKPAPRRLLVNKTDVLVIGGYEIDAAILTDIIKPDKRLLWAFVAKGTQVQPVCFSEEHCVWLLESDLDRSGEV